MSAAADFYRFLTEIGVTPDALIDAFEEMSKNFSDDLVKASIPLLTATLAIRIIGGVIKELVDGDLVDVISTVIFGMLMGVILFALLSGWNGFPIGGSGTEFGVRPITLAIKDAFIALASGGETAGTLVGQFFGEAADAIMRMYAMATRIQDGMFASFAAAMALVPRWSVTGMVGVLISSIPFVLLMLVAWIAYGIASIAIVILMAVITYHALSGVVMIHAALAFGPVTLAVYPLIDSWAKRILNTLASGIAQVTAGILLLVVLQGLIVRIDGTLSNIMAGWAGFTIP
jgi:hypothetical protein